MNHPLNNNISSGGEEIKKNYSSEENGFEFIQGGDSGTDSEPEQDGIVSSKRQTAPMKMPWACLAASGQSNDQKVQQDSPDVFEQAAELRSEIMTESATKDQKTEGFLKVHGKKCSQTHTRQATEIAKVIEELYKPRGARMVTPLLQKTNSKEENGVQGKSGIKKAFSSTNFMMLEIDGKLPMGLDAVQMTHEEIQEKIMNLMAQQGNCASESSRSSRQRNSATSSQLAINSTSFSISIYVYVRRTKYVNGIPGSTLAEVWTISLTDGPAELSQHEQDSQDAAEQATKKERRQSLRELEPSLKINIVQDYFVQDTDKIRSDQIQTLRKSVQKVCEELPIQGLTNGNYYSSEVRMEKGVEEQLGSHSITKHLPTQEVYDIGKIKVQVDYIEENEIKHNITRNANSRRKSPVDPKNQPPAKATRPSNDSVMGSNAPAKQSNNPFLAFQRRDRLFTEDQELLEERRKFNQTRKSHLSGNKMPTAAFNALAAEQLPDSENATKKPSKQNSNNFQTGQNEVSNDAQDSQGGFMRRLSNAAAGISGFVGLSRKSSNVSGPGQDLNQSESSQQYNLSPPVRRQSQFAPEQMSQEAQPKSARSGNPVTSDTSSAMKSSIFARERQQMIEKQLIHQQAESKFFSQTEVENLKISRTSENAGPFILMKMDQNGNKTELPLQNSQLIQEKSIHSSLEMDMTQELPSSLEQSPEKQEGLSGKSNLENKFSHIFDSESEDSDCQEDKKTSLRKSYMHLGAEDNLKLSQLQKRKDTASTKAGSYSEEDQFEYFQQSVKLLQQQIKESQSFMKERQVTSSSKQDLTNQKSNEDLLKECGSIVFILNEDDKNEESNRSLQEKMHKSFIDVLKVQRAVNKTFQE